MVTTVSEAPAVVVMAAVPVVAPAAIVKEAGNVAAAELEPNATGYPPAGAGFAIVTVTLLPALPTMDELRTVTPVMTEAVTAKGAVTFA